MSRMLPIAIAIACMTSTVYGQNQVVQQPVVRQLRIGTAVSVPDQGRAYLGGVSRGAVGTNRYGGPLRSGTSSGREHSDSSMSVSVFIHDFEAMDEALLAEASRSQKNRPSKASANLDSAEQRRLRSRARSAWRSLGSQHAGR